MYFFKNGTTAIFKTFLSIQMAPTNQEFNGYKGRGLGFSAISKLTGACNKFHDLMKLKSPCTYPV